MITRQATIIFDLYPSPNVTTGENTYPPWEPAPPSEGDRGAILATIPGHPRDALQKKGFPPPRGPGASAAIGRPGLARPGDHHRRERSSGAAMTGRHAERATTQGNQGVLRRSFIFGLAALVLLAGATLAPAQPPGPPKPAGAATAFNPATNFTIVKIDPDPWAGEVRITFATRCLWNSSGSISASCP